MLQLLTNNLVFFSVVWVSFLELGLLINLVYFLTSCLLEISAVVEELSCLRVVRASEL